MTPPGAFDYTNLSSRPTSRFLTILTRLLPGVDKVEREIAPYAAAWHEYNVASLASSKPLWVVLGDSLSQGVGASSIEQSWVLQARRRLATQGLDYRVINLSISGATVADVVDHQLAALTGLAATPAVLTVLIGSNDIIHHKLRVTLLANYQAMLTALPAGTYVAVADRAPGILGQVGALVDREAQTGRVRAVRVRLSSPLRAEDHFHLNDEGYQQVAEDFAAAIAHRPKEPS